MTCGTGGAGAILFVGLGSPLVTVTKSVVVVSGIVGSVKVIVTKVSAEDDDVAVVVITPGFVNTKVVAGMVIMPPVKDVEVVAVAANPRTLDANALSVHSTTTPTVVFIGIAKHSDPVAHTLITKLPAWLQVAILPERQAIFPGVHGDEKLRVEKKVL